MFEIRVDDGDGKYEPNADDGGVVATLKATDGYVVYNPGLPGDYWVKEVDAPNGLSKAAAMRVKYRTPETPENCFVVDGKKQCKPDEDGSGGFTVAAIVDSPIGAPPTEARPAAPATDTDPAPAPTPRNDTTWLLLGLVGVASAAAYLARTAPRREPQRTPGRGSNPPATPRRSPAAPPRDALKQAPLARNDRKGRAHAPRYSGLLGLLGRRP